MAIRKLLDVGPNRQHRHFGRLRSDVRVRAGRAPLVVSDEPNTEVTNRVGPYVVREPLRSTTMFDVNLAVDPREQGLQRLVALKTPRARYLADENVRAQLADEALIASLVRHECLCAVTGFGRAVDGWPYLATEYVCGEPLTAVAPLLLPGGDDAPAVVRSRVGTVIDIVVRIASALHALHEARDTEGQPLDAIHRNVALDSILIGCTGRIVLADANVLTAAARHTSTRTRWRDSGLPHLAPEARDGRPVDRRSNVYTLGVIAWELLSGMPAPRPPDGSGLFAPGATAHDVPTAVSDAVLQAVAINPEQRFQTAAAFATALTASRRGMPLPATRLDTLIRDHFGHRASCHAATLRRVDGSSLMPGRE